MLRRICWVGLAIAAISSGCTHNYYYGTATGCPPIGQPVPTQLGQICEIPGETVVTSNTTSAPIGQPSANAHLSSVPQAQRVVISQPAYNASSTNRFRWHRPEPESMATTRSEGSLQDPTYK